MGDATTPLSVEGVSILASFVIRPPRARYNRRDLGPKKFQSSTPHPVTVTRTDLQLVNARGLTLECSHYVPSSSQDGSQSSQAMPVVVYLHGNGSCRVEAELLFDHTLPYGMSVFSFDFSGSGKSGGEYISLGVFEKYDVETVVKYLSSCAHVSSIALWGHSMGAATAAMYAGYVDPSAVGDRISPPEDGPVPARIPRLSLIRGRSKLNIGRERKAISPAGRGSDAIENPVALPVLPDASRSPLTEASKEGSARVNALVLDSAFASFDKLANAMVQTMPLPAAVPRRLILSVGVRAVRKAVRDKAGFDVNDIDPLTAAKRIRPSLATLMLQGSEDEIVHLAHAQLLFDAQSGRDVELVTMEGIDHDAPRPSFAIEKAFILLQRTLFDAHGKLSLRYCNALKVRGNDCMVQGHFDDAVFLYSDALQSLVEQEREEYGHCWRGASSSTPLPDSAAAVRGDVGGQAAGNLELPESAESGETSHNDICHLWPDSEDESLPRPSTGTNPNELPKKRLSMRVGGLIAGMNRRLSRATAAPGTNNFGSSPGRERAPPLSSERLLHSTTGSAESRPLPLDRVNSAGVDRRRKGRLAFPALGPMRSGNSVDDRSVSRGRFGAGPRNNLTSHRSFDDAATAEDVIRKHGLSGERKDVALALLGNRSLANLRMKKCEMALTDAEFALELEKTWVRGYQRKAAALKALNRIEDARACVLAGLTIAPVNAALLNMEAEFEDEALAAALEASMEDPRPASSAPSASGAFKEGGHSVDATAGTSELVNTSDAGPPETISTTASAHT